MTYKSNQFLLNLWRRLHTGHWFKIWHFVLIYNYLYGLLTYVIITYLERHLMPFSNLHDITEFPVTFQLGTERNADISARSSFKCHWKSVHRSDWEIGKESSQNLLDELSLKGSTTKFLLVMGNETKLSRMMLSILKLRIIEGFHKANCNHQTCSFRYRFGIENLNWRSTIRTMELWDNFWYVEKVIIHSSNRNVYRYKSY